MPLPWITAWEALIERLNIRQGEEVEVLIITGYEYVGSVASQFARSVLKLPVVVTTTSREETTKFSEEVAGAANTINHRGNIIK